MLNVSHFLSTDLNFEESLLNLKHKYKHFIPNFTTYVMS